MIVTMRAPNAVVVIHRRTGSVLIIVLWMSLGLVSIALLFGHSMVFQYRASENNIAGRKAEHAIESAREYIQLILANNEEPGTVPDIDTYESEAVIVGDTAFWILGRGDDDQADNVPVYGLIGESSKLNLNTATQEMLEALPGMTTQLAAAIIDWRDTDTEITSEGAESETYLLRDPKYNCKDSNFESIEELHLLNGADWEILYGEDGNRNGVLEENEDDGQTVLPDDNRDGQLDPGILEYVTVFSREPNKDSDGEDRINLNGDNAEDLTNMLVEALGQERATQIQQGAGGGQTEYESVLEYIVRAGLTLDEAAEVADKLTVSDDEYLEGFVNVNIASSAVLACIPGIGAEYADRLIAYRQSNSDNLDCVAWVAEVLDDESAVSAGPYISTKSYQFTVDVAAVDIRGRGYRRTSFVIDTSGDTPTVVYRRDLGRLGWALGSEIRQMLSNEAES